MIDYLKEHAPELVPLAKKRYCCFDREDLDPQQYGLASAYNAKRRFVSLLLFFLFCIVFCLCFIVFFPRFILICFGFYLRVCVVVCSIGLLMILMILYSCQEGAIKMLADMRKLEAKAMQEDGLKIDSSFYARVNAQVLTH